MTSNSIPGASDDVRLRSPYGPVRTSASAWASFVTDEVRRGGGVKEDGTIYNEFADWFSKNILARMMDATLSIPLDSDGARRAQAQAGMMTIGTSLMPAWGQYVACGRQIFEFTPGLVEALLQTDVGDTKLAGLEYPFRAFFVRFGPQPSLGLPWGDQQEYVDGAYFNFTESDSGHPTLLINLTMVLANGTGFLTPGPSLSIPGKYFDLPIREALEKSVADMRALFLEMHQQLQRNPRGPSASMAASLYGQVEEIEDLAQRVLPLLVNSLYYLSDPPKVEPKPGSDTPADLRTKIEKPNTVKAGRKSEALLPAFGYAMVRLCGAEFETEANGMRGSSTQAHWRRGHYRDQRHGPAMSLVKRIWIRPVKVNADAAFDTPGHIYVADQVPRA